MKTRDLHVESIRPLLPPAILLEELPLDETGSLVVGRARQEITRILTGEDDRLIVVVGPCSIHDPAAGLDYGRRLKRREVLSGRVSRPVEHSQRRDPVRIPDQWNDVLPRRDALLRGSRGIVFAEQSKQVDGALRVASRAQRGTRQAHLPDVDTPLKQIEARVPDEEFRELHVIRRQMRTLQRQVRGGDLFHVELEVKRVELAQLLLPDERGVELDREP